MLQELARRYAVGICVLVAEGKTTDAVEATKVFVAEAMALGHTPFDAMFALFQTSVGCAVAAGDYIPGGAAEYFSGCALGLAVQS
jgi:hypothetical protein